MRRLYHIAVAVLLIVGGGYVAWVVTGRPPAARVREETTDEVRDAVGAGAERVVEQVRVVTPTPVPLTPAMVVRDLRGASELTTAIYTMETVVDESQERRIGAFPLGRTQLLYIAHGQVRAGVDLDAITEDDVTVDGGVITVRLPSPRVLDAKIDVDRSYTYDVRRSLLGPAAPDLQSRAERAALAKILEGACGDGLLAEANDRAALAVRKLLEAATDVRVAVETRPEGPDACRLPTGTPLTSVTRTPELRGTPRAALTPSVRATAGATTTTTATAFTAATATAR